MINGKTRFCWSILSILICWMGVLYADDGAPSWPDDPLRPTVASHPVKLVVNIIPYPDIPWPLISITPTGLPHQSKIKVESYVSPIFSYIFYYRSTHPYASVSPAVDIWRDTLRTSIAAPGTNNYIIDSTSGVGDPQQNYCYWARTVDATVPSDPTQWIFTAPSNVVCDWDYALAAPTGLNHWNQVAMPLYDMSTDSLVQVGNRIGGNNLEITRWSAATQTWNLQARKLAGTWVSGSNRITRFGHIYNLNVETPGVLSLWGQRYNDVDDSLYHHDTLTSFSPVMIQPAWHWFQAESTSYYELMGHQLYDGTTTHDYGVRSILEWSAQTQSWSVRTSYRNGAWAPRGGLKVFQPLMLTRRNNNIPGGGSAAVVMWPPILR